MKHAVAAVVALIAGLGCLAATALTLYCVYRHWSLPKAGRGDDVWGSLCVASALVAGVFGAVTIGILEDAL